MAQKPKKFAFKVLVFLFCLGSLIIFLYSVFQSRIDNAFESIKEYVTYSKIGSKYRACERDYQTYRHNCHEIAVFYLNRCVGNEPRDCLYLHLLQTRTHVLDEKEMMNCANPLKKACDLRLEDACTLQRQQKIRE